MESGASQTLAFVAVGLLWVVLAFSSGYKMAKDKFGEQVSETYQQQCVD